MRGLHFDRLAQALAATAARRRVLASLGVGAVGATVSRGRVSAQNESCYGACGEATGACHTRCGSGESCHAACVNELYACFSRCSGSSVSGVVCSPSSNEQACHDCCNATVAPGPALGACHAACGFGSAVSPNVCNSSSSEEVCHDCCNARVPPGPALGACHAACGGGSGDPHRHRHHHHHRRSRHH